MNLLPYLCSQGWLHALALLSLPLLAVFGIIALCKPRLVVAFWQAAHVQFMLFTWQVGVVAAHTVYLSEMDAGYKADLFLRACGAILVEFVVLLLFLIATVLRSPQPLRINWAAIASSQAIFTTAILHWSWWIQLYMIAAK